MVRVFKNVGEMCTSENCSPVEKLVNNKLIDHLEKVVWFQVLLINCRFSNSC